MKSDKKNGNGNGNERLKGGVGGGPIQIPQATLLRTPGKKFQKPVDRAEVRTEIDQRIVEVTENITNLHALGMWLVEIFSSSTTQAERDQFAAEIKSYAGDLETATTDSNPAIRRVGAFEWLRWKFSSQFTSWEEVGQVVTEMANKGILVVEKDSEKFLCRCGQTGYSVEPGLELEPAQLAEARSWFGRIAGEINTHTRKGWDATIKVMKQKSIITLEQLVLGEPGRCCIVVPDDPYYRGRDNRLQPLEGGHLLVNSVNGKIFVEDAAGDPATGKGFAFVRRILAIRKLRPNAFLAVYKLKCWSPWPKLKVGQEQTEGQKKAKAFFDQNPDHASACTVLYSSIRRSIKLAFKEGKFDNNKAHVQYLFSQPVQSTEQEPEPVIVDDTEAPVQKPRRVGKKKDNQVACVPVA